MTTRTAIEPAFCAGNGGFSIAADRPDAAPQRGDDAVRIVCHALALLAMVALLAYCVIWAPRGQHVAVSGGMMGREMAVGASAGGVK